MARAPASFRQRDVTAALKGAADAGLSVARYTIDRDGKITVIAGQPCSASEEAEATETPEDLRKLV